MPADKLSMPAVEEYAINTKPAQYSTAPTASTTNEPKRSAIAPANGVTVPHAST